MQNKFRIFKLLFNRAGGEIPCTQIFKIMYKTQITVIPKEHGESIEEMIRRETANNNPIEASAPMIYTEKAKGVEPQYDIRTDRFDLALDAIEKVQKSEIAKAAEAAQQNETTKEPTTDLEF